MKLIYEIKYLGIKVINNLRFSISSDIYLLTPELFHIFLLSGTVPIIKAIITAINRSL